jgi:hypothetical protein
MSGERDSRRRCRLLDPRTYQGFEVFALAPELPEFRDDELFARRFLPFLWYQAQPLHYPILT